ncbi:MAG: peptide deformylase [Actinomycetota bacterium]|nr:peptide deformylase [Actinomycetota bacterium]
MSEDQGQVRDVELDAEAQARRRFALAQIRQYPDPVLRMQAKPVEEFDADLARLVERMKALMIDASGVGLAGTQVGVLRRLFVFQYAEDDLRALVNPRIVERGDELEVSDEGCLSMQGVLIPVERPLAVTMEGQDETGAEVRLELEELPARVAQHELDHLDGLLILDRTTPEGKREALARLRPQPLLG